MCFLSVACHQACVSKFLVTFCRNVGEDMVMFAKVFTILLLDYSTGQRGYLDSDGYYGATLEKDYEATGLDYRQKIIW